MKEGLKSTNILNKTITQKQFEIESLSNDIDALENELNLLKDHTRKQQ